MEWESRRALRGPQTQRRSRFHQAAVCRLQHLTHGSVARDGIRLRPDRAKVKPPLVVGAQLAATARLREAFVLHIVEPVFVRLPDREVGARYGLPAHRSHLALDETRLAGGAVGEVVAVLEEGRVLDKERPEHRRLGGTGWLLVVDPDDKHRHAQGVGEQDELLALIVGHVASPGEEIDGLKPFLLGQSHLAYEGVQVPDEALHDLLETRRPAAIEARKHRLGEFLVRQISRPARHRPGLALIHLFSFPKVSYRSRRPWRCPGRLLYTSWRAHIGPRASAPSHEQAS